MNAETSDAIKERMRRATTPELLELKFLAEWVLLERGYDVH